MEKTENCLSSIDTDRVESIACVLKEYAIDMHKEEQTTILISMSFTSSDQVNQSESARGSDHPVPCYS